MNVSFMLILVVVSQTTGQVYDLHTQTCCDGIVQNLSDDMRGGWLECCGASVYDRKNSRCCNGEVLELPPNITDVYDFGCCGRTSYIYNEFKCCKDKLYSKSEKICNEIDGTLFDIADNKDLGFCNGTAYNVSYQQCSYYDGYMIDRSKIICNRNDSKESARGCCGNTAYDPHNELCCIDTIHELNINTAIRTHNQCCGRDVYAIPSKNDMYPHRGKFTCCGDVITEKSSVTEECCGSIRYNTTESLCCEGVLHENAQFGDKCCGTASYNVKSFRCCNGKIYPLGFSEQGCYYNMGNPKDWENYLSEHKDMLSSPRSYRYSRYTGGI